MAMSIIQLNNRAVISGVGQSQVARRLPMSGLSLTVDAALEAMSAAGLRPADIDGIATWPGRDSSNSAVSPVGVSELKNAFGFKLNWFEGGGESSSQLGSIVNAAAAVSMGLARHVICFRTVKEGSGRMQQQSSDRPKAGLPQGVDEKFQWQLPFNAISASSWQALIAQIYMNDYGMRREQMAQIALNARRNAALNPKAIYTQALSLEAYMNSRMISSPFCLYDCDIPVDAATVVIVSSADAAADLRKPPIRIAGIGCAQHDMDSWDQTEVFTEMACHSAARMMWQTTDYKPADVDQAQLYDGFSFLSLMWLEAFGFCGKGESPQYVEDGIRISREGALPINTHGGQLSAGRTHGMGFLHEACTQLWGEGGARQTGAPKVSVVGTGGGPYATALLLTTES
jgi:acetyl-CoA acetyltransferase